MTLQTLLVSPAECQLHHNVLSHELGWWDLIDQPRDDHQKPHQEPNKT